MCGCSVCATAAQAARGRARAPGAAARAPGRAGRASARRARAAGDRRGRAAGPDNGRSRPTGSTIHAAATAAERAGERERAERDAPPRVRARADRPSQRPGCRCRAPCGGRSRCAGPRPGPARTRRGRGVRVIARRAHERAAADSARLTDLVTGDLTAAGCQPQLLDGEQALAALARVINPTGEHPRRSPSVPQVLETADRQQRARAPRRAAAARSGQRGCGVAARLARAPGHRRAGSDRAPGRRAGGHERVVAAGPDAGPAAVATGRARHRDRPGPAATPLPAAAPSPVGGSAAPRTRRQADQRGRLRARTRSRRDRRRAAPDRRRRHLRRLRLPRHPPTPGDSRRSSPSCSRALARDFESYTDARLYSGRFLVEPSWISTLPLATDRLGATRRFAQRNIADCLPLHSLSASADGRRAARVRACRAARSSASTPFDPAYRTHVALVTGASGSRQDGVRERAAGPQPRPRRDRVHHRPLLQRTRRGRHPARRPLRAARRADPRRARDPLRRRRPRRDHQPLGHARPRARAGQQGRVPDRAARAADRRPHPDRARRSRPRTHAARARDPRRLRHCARTGELPRERLLREELRRSRASRADDTGDGDASVAVRATPPGRAPAPLRRRRPARRG